MRIPSIEEYLEKNRHTPENEKLILQGFWHYPSRGEYPPKGRQVLVYAWDVHFVLAKYDNMRTIDEGDKDMFVTYDAYCVMREIKKVIAWMPLPEPPKDVK